MCFENSLLTKYLAEHAPSDSTEVLLLALSAFLIYITCPGPFKAFEFETTVRCDKCSTRDMNKSCTKSWGWRIAFVGRKREGGRRGVLVSKVHGVFYHTPEMGPGAEVWLCHA